MISAKLLATAAAVIATLSLAHLPASGSPQNNTCLKVCHVDESGLSFLRNVEGFYPFVYKDGAGVDTIGFGHALRPGEKIAVPLTAPDAEKLLESDLSAKEKAINRMVAIELRIGQFNALASFTYNLGEGSLQRSTLLKKVNAGQHKAVPPEFLKWVFAGGRKLEGLVVRRQAEAEMYASAP